MLPAQPSLAIVEQYITTEKRGNCIPVFVELPAHFLTPCMAYMRIAKDSKYSFLLESILGGESVARFSFIGAGAFSVPALRSMLKRARKTRSRSSGPAQGSTRRATRWQSCRRSSRCTSTSRSRRSQRSPVRPRRPSLLAQQH